MRCRATASRTRCGRCPTLVAFAVCVALWALPRPTAAQELIGRYEVNYRFNAAGCPPGDGNPFECVGPAPGPYYLSLAPGRYRVVVIGQQGHGGNAVVWSGDASGGVGYGGLGLGVTRDFVHTHGQIVLYAFDWFTDDNDPSSTTTLELYRLNNDECVPGETTALVDFPTLETPAPVTLWPNLKQFGAVIEPLSVTFTAVESIDGSRCTFAGHGAREVTANFYYLPGVPIFPNRLGIGSATFTVQLDVNPTAPPPQQCDYRQFDGDPGHGGECFHNTPTTDPRSIVRWRGHVDLGLFPTETYDRVFWVNTAELGLSVDTPLDQLVRRVELYVDDTNFRRLPSIFLHPMLLIMDPPATVAVEDPEGRQAGLHTANDIPNATVVQHEHLSAVLIVKPDDGLYTVHAFGQPFEEFSLSMMRLDFTRGIDHAADDNITIPSGNLGPSGLRSFLFEAGPPPSVAVNPRAVREHAIEALSNEHPGVALAHAIRKLRRGLGAERWLNAFHLNRRRGHVVFAIDHDVVRDLMAWSRSRWTVDARMLVTALVQSDRTLAEVGILDMEATVGASDSKRDRHLQRDLSLARSELAKGDLAAKQGRPDLAIQRYRRAWHYTSTADDDPSSRRDNDRDQKKR